MQLQIVESNADTYTVELLAKMKKITIEKSKTVVVGDKEGSLASEARSLPAYDGAIPATPFYTQDTPHYLQGGVTPHHYGNETPGSMTPGNVVVVVEENKILLFHIVRYIFFKIFKIQYIFVHFLIYTNFLH